MIQTIVVAPWTPQQVNWLARWQASPTIYPYTCPDRADATTHLAGTVLVPTIRGWICPYCSYTQDWACLPPIPSEDAPTP